MSFSLSFRRGAALAFAVMLFPRLNTESFLLSSFPGFAAAEVVETAGALVVRRANTRRRGPWALPLGDLGNRLVVVVCEANRCNRALFSSVPFPKILLRSLVVVELHLHSYFIGRFFAVF